MSPLMSILTRCFRIVVSVSCRFLVGMEYRWLPLAYIVICYLQILLVLVVVVVLGRFLGSLV
jgi:hypothetical protein